MRPEHLVLGDGADGRSFDCVVEVVEQLGSEILLEARLGATRITVPRVPAEAPSPPAIGCAVGAAGPAAFLRRREPTRRLPPDVGAIVPSACGRARHAAGRRLRGAAVRRLRRRGDQGRARGGKRDNTLDV
jgi:hypothetical protein